MKDLTKEELNIICEAMGAQYRSLTDLSRTNIPHSVKIVTEVEAHKVMNVWEKVEKYKNSLPNKLKDEGDKLGFS